MASVQRWRWFSLRRPQDLQGQARIEKQTVNEIGAGLVEHRPKTEKGGWQAL
jgi:hypothetical protein